jgi:thioredoxin-like negative regulator of GroEL
LEVRESGTYIRRTTGTQSQPYCAEVSVDTSRPGLIFFHSRRSGSSRRAEGYLAQVLQWRRNHDTFALYRIAREERPDLHERFGIEQLPTLCVIEDRSVRATLESPKGAREIATFLADWLH